MRTIKIFLIINILFVGAINGRENTINNLLNDTTNNLLFNEYNKRIAEFEQQRLADSISKQALKERLDALAYTDIIQKTELIKQLQDIENKNNERLMRKKAKIDSIKSNAKGYAVEGILNDTLFYLYSSVGSITPSERATNTTRKIAALYKDDYLKIDSILIVPSEYTIDIIYKGLIILSVSETDALWQNTTREQAANQYLETIKSTIIKAKNEFKISKILTRIGLSATIIIVIILLIWLVGKGYRKLLLKVYNNKSEWLKDLTYKGYTFLSVEQEYKAINGILKGLRWITYILLLYIAIPILFSIFPFTRHRAGDLYKWIWQPFKSMFVTIWEYIPNLFTILIIYFAFKYVIRFVKYVFNEIHHEKFKISGFHPDWAMPTYSIIKFLLYAFMFILIFPYLPGSDSAIFKGVSVFIGVLFSLGSSTAIANMVAGIVITYMRPFKIGDRIKIGDVYGDVEEKTLLVTRIKTPKNEIVTIPNSSILSGNTINYSNETDKNGLILHTKVSISYHIPWRKVHKALIDAALRTNYILKDPKPFVLQESLDDFYVAYQINAYTKEFNKQASIYSELRQNIQDSCAENDVEILSPHYLLAEKEHIKQKIAKVKQT